MNLAHASNTINMYLSKVFTFIILPGRTRWHAGQVWCLVDRHVHVCTTEQNREKVPPKIKLNIT